MERCRVRKAMIIRGHLLYIGAKGQGYVGPLGKLGRHRWVKAGPGDSVTRHGRLGPDPPRNSRKKAILKAPLRCVL